MRLAPRKQEGDRGTSSPASDKENRVGVGTAAAAFLIKWTISCSPTIFSFRAAIADSIASVWWDLLGIFLRDVERLHLLSEPTEDERDGVSDLSGGWQVREGDLTPPWESVVHLRSEGPRGLEAGK